MKSMLKQLVKVGVILSAMVAGSVWAQQCGVGFMGPEGLCHNTGLGGTVPLGTPGIERGSYPSNGGSGGYSSYPTAPALRSSFGAVAVNPHTARFGYSGKQASKQASKQAALEDCDQQGCKVIATYSNQCAALAWGKRNDGRGYFASGFNLNNTVAAQNALSNCNSKANNCQVLVSECSLPS